MHNPPDFIASNMTHVLASLKTLAALDNREFGKRLREACALAD
jgi:hypothetical protein